MVDYVNMGTFRKTEMQKINEKKLYRNEGLRTLFFISAKKKIM